MQKHCLRVHRCRQIKSSNKSKAVCNKMENEEQQYNGYLNRKKTISKQFDWRNIKMEQQIDTNSLKKAEAVTSIAKDLIVQAIEQSASNQILCEEALKQAANEIKQAQTMISQVQSTFQTNKAQQSE